MSIDDGGPAFPIAEHDSGVFTGISIRDYFAGQALAGICGDGIPGGHHRPEETAREACIYADAMLKERAK